jgi:hypothetical protein
MQGKPLIAAIVQGLAAEGYTCGEPCAASHGWEVDVKVAGDSYTINAGLRGADDADRSEWLVFVTLTPNRMQALKRELVPAPNRPETRKLLVALHQVLSAMDGAINLRWHDGARFDRGDEDHAAPMPV